MVLNGLKINLSLMKPICMVKKDMPYAICHAQNLLAKKMQRTQILMNKPVYLGLSTLEISKKVMYEFWYGYVKPKYGARAQV